MSSARATIAQQLLDSASTMADGEWVRVEGLEKLYVKGSERLHVLRGVDLALAAGERIAIVGESGSGKSTLLHLIGTLDHPTKGTVLFDGRDVFRLRPRELDAVRNRWIGFVFQFHHLLPDQDAVQNVMMPALIGGESAARAEARAREKLALVGLADRATHRPGELSGGEQQRVAIARALMNDPRLLLADEPTGNLDPATAGRVMDLLLELNERLGVVLVVVTHSREVAGRFPRRLELVAGHLQELGASDAETSDAMTSDGELSDAELEDGTLA